MNKIIISALALAISCASCNNAASDAGKKNLEAMNIVNDAIKSGDFSKVGDAIAADGVDHAGMQGDVKGLDNIKAELVKFCKMSKDMNYVIVKELADGEYGFQWLRLTGTVVAEGMGMPVGTKYDMSAIEVAKFKDGKATEHWEFMQPAEMMKMMAGAPQPGMGGQPKADTTKMDNKMSGSKMDTSKMK